MCRLIKIIVSLLLVVGMTSSILVESFEIFEAQNLATSNECSLSSGSSVSDSGEGHVDGICISHCHCFSLPTYSLSLDLNAQAFNASETSRDIQFVSGNLFRPPRA